ncbi:Microtubule binding Kinesin motor domain [Trypanosoma vivax]|nr:Microtubule binding Kinesin motor domain [Trypanosoma vivax]
MTDQVAAVQTVASPLVAPKGEDGRSQSKGGARAVPASGVATVEGDEPKNVSRCLVYCRLRPRNKTDFKNGGFQLVTVSENNVIVKDQRYYKFDGAFNEDCTQENIFDAVAVPCVTHAFKGFCSALMCYGQTGTGKSFTMCNTTPGSEGIIPRTAKFIFDTVEADRSRSYEVIGQFVQIYRDNLGDLMVGNGKDRVDIHFDDEGGVDLTGCSSHVLKSAQEFMRFYNSGNDRRVVTATAMNPESSRGHTALILRIISESVDDPASGKLKGKITFIDLAGYERFSKTGITHDNPIMKDEAKCINASLLSLGHVVSCLSSGSRHIPWRDSKLTRILQDSIGGRSRTSIILTVGPSSDHLHETTNSLQFGLRAMDVKVTAKQSVHVDYEKLARKLQLLLEEKDEKINFLEVQIASQDAERQELLEMYNAHRKAIDQRFENDMAQLTKTGASEQQILNLREVYKAEVENLREQQDEDILYREEEYSKRISKLVRDQVRQEEKRRAEMKLAQERIIEDFQKKLDKAREGTNDDLVKALQQLAEKDSILASRANDTARLHEHIEVLTEQVKELGGVPVEEATFPETFLDVGQVEEMQMQLEAEVERHRSKGIGLRAEVDRLSHLCTERLEEINKLNRENSQLREVLRESGIAIEDTDEVEQFMREARTRMIDISEMETLRVTMQEDLNEVKAHNRELEREVKRLRDELSTKAVPLTARIHRGTCGFGPNTVRGLGSTQTFSRTQHGLYTPPPSKPLEDSQRFVKKLSNQLEFSMREKNSLQERVTALEAELATHGQETPRPYVPPIMLQLSSFSTPLPGDEDNEPPTGKDVDVLLQVKDDEIDSLLETIEQQEFMLNTARSNDEFQKQLICELQQQVVAAKLDVKEHKTLPPPVDSISISDYMCLLRTIRDSERKLTTQLAERDGRDPVELDALLEKRDKELLLKDEAIVEKASKAQFVAKVCIRLKNQMERLGITPCCRLPDSYNELIEQEVCELENQVETQRELEERLRLEEEEKQRMANMLQSLKEERERQANVIRSVQARCREVEEKEMATAAHLSRLAKEKSQRELILEDTLRRATQELIESRVRLAMAEEVVESGMFNRLIRRWKQR